MAQSLCSHIGQVSSGKRRNVGGACQSIHSGFPAPEIDPDPSWVNVGLIKSSGLQRELMKRISGDKVCFDIYEATAFEH